MAYKLILLLFYKLELLSFNEDQFVIFFHGLFLCYYCVQEVIAKLKIILTFSYIIH